MEISVPDRAADAVQRGPGVVNALDDGSGPPHPACSRLRVLAVRGGYLRRAAADAAIGAERVPDRRRDLGLSVRSEPTGH